MGRPERGKERAGAEGILKRGGLKSSTGRFVSMSWTVCFSQISVLPSEPAFGGFCQATVEFREIKKIWPG